MLVHAGIDGLDQPVKIVVSVTGSSGAVVKSLAGDAVV